MKHKCKSDYPEVISMEEYLKKRKKIREKEQTKERDYILGENPRWVLAELYV